MSEATQRSHEVFISYSTKDKPWADAACAVLERHRIRCWIAPRDIMPGTEWTAAIMRGLENCRVMVLILSGHANASPQVRREVERAVSKGLSVLPVRVEDVHPAEGMEYLLSTTHWLDVFTPPVERQMEVLATSVEALLGKEGPADSVSKSSGPTAGCIDPAADPGGPGSSPVAPPTGRGPGRWRAAVAVLVLLAGGATVATMLRRDGVDKKEAAGPVPTATAKGLLPDRPVTKEAVADSPAPKVPVPEFQAAPARPDSHPPASSPLPTARANRLTVVPTAHVVNSHFNDGTKEGWTTMNQDGTNDEAPRFWIDRKAKNCWLVAQGKGSGKLWGWCAPRAYRGDHSDKFRRYLRYSIFTTMGRGLDSMRCVRIKGAGKTIYVELSTVGHPVANQWKNCRIALDSSIGWKVATNNRQNVEATDEEIKQILADVTEIWIRGEFGSGSLGCLDNVEFGAVR